MKKLLRILLKIILWFIIISAGTTLLFRFVPVPVTFLMLQRCVEQKMKGENIKLKKDWAPLNEISPALVLAVVASEDNNFTSHYGFDFEAIQKAYIYNQKKHKKRTLGASTITQQTAKNVFLWPGRNWIRKGFEVYFTLLVELLWGKQRIMEVYLNVIEMGNGIYGAEAASQNYFKKNAGKLTKNEAALLAAILPNPLKYSPVKPSTYIQKRKLRISWNMNNIEKVKL